MSCSVARRLERGEIETLLPFGWVVTDDECGLKLGWYSERAGNRSDFLFNECTPRVDERPEKAGCGMMWWRSIIAVPGEG